MPTPEGLRKLIAENGIQIVDLKFTDLAGTWQHFSMPVAELDTGIWDDGIGFDGSSIRGFQQIQESDMNLFLDASTAVVDPACKIPTAVTPLRHLRPADEAALQPRPALHRPQGRGLPEVHRHRRHELLGPGARSSSSSTTFASTSKQNQAFYYIDSVEGELEHGPRARSPNLGYKPRYKEGYFPVPPTDSLQDIRSEMIIKMGEAGIQVERQHHEVATAGQAEIDFRFGTLVQTADRVMMYKYIVKNVARAHGKVATFMPKPLFGDNGSGMHTHQSLFKDGKTLMYDSKGYAGHQRPLPVVHRRPAASTRASILAFAAPTTNSYKRLVPGFEAPVNLVYSARNRSAVCRIPMYVDSPQGQAHRVPRARPELQPLPCVRGDAHGRPGRRYRTRSTRGQPLDKNTYELSDREQRRMRTVPGSLDEALDALERDHAYLLKGGVFTQDVIDTWLDYKRAEVPQVSHAPAPLRVPPLLRRLTPSTETERTFRRCGRNGVSRWPSGQLEGSGRQPPSGR